MVLCLHCKQRDEAVAAVEGSQIVADMALEMGSG
jgi:hypothetical protein